MDCLRLSRPSKFLVAIWDLRRQRFDVSVSLGAHNINISTVNISVASSVIASISTQTDTMFEFTILGFDVQFILGLILGLSIGRIGTFFAASIIHFESYFLEQSTPKASRSSCFIIFAVVIAGFDWYHDIISSWFGSVHWHNFEFGKLPLSTDFFWLLLSSNQDSEGGNLVDCYVNGFGRNHSCVSFLSSCKDPCICLADQKR